jgi:hypothetical protein
MNQRRNFLTMIFLHQLLIITSAWAGPTDCAEISFAWSKLPKSNPLNVVAPADAIGYNVYYGPGPANAYIVNPQTGVGNPTIPGPYSVTLPNKVSVGANPTLVLQGLNPNLQYYFRITAYNAAGVETPYGNTFTHGITPPCAAPATPPAPPSKLRLVNGKIIFIEDLVNSNEPHSEKVETYLPEGPADNHSHEKIKNQI